MSLIDELKSFGVTLDEKGIRILELLQQESIYSDRLTAENVLEGIYRGLASSVEDRYTRYIKQYRGKEELFEKELGIRINNRCKVIHIEKDGISDKHGVTTEYTLIDVYSRVDWDTKIVYNIAEFVNYESEEVIKVTFEDVLKNTEKIININIQNNTHYIKISDFAGKYLGLIFQHMFVSIMHENKDVNIILDIRDNPGGCYSTFMKICSLLLNKKAEIGTNIDIDYTSNGQEHKVEHKQYTLNGYNKFADSNIIVLVDKESASVSDRIAKILNKYGAILIGEQTYGKWEGQIVFALDETSGIKLTSRKTEGEGLIGIKPTIEMHEDIVENPLEDKLVLKALELFDKHIYTVEDYNKTKSREIKV